MQRFVLAAVAALSVAPTTAASVPASQPLVRLRGFACERAVSPIARSISVMAVMRPMAGTVKLQMRFDLLSKPKGSFGYTLVGGGDLGTWIPPKNPTLGQRPGDVWNVRKRVADLSTPGMYRLQVSFRWLGGHNRVLGTTTRLTPVCPQPELRPDLLVKSITIQTLPKRPALNRFLATIVNAGATAAGPFDVLFSPGGGGATTTRSEVGLAAHHRLVESFLGPACNTTSATTVTVDPAGAVDDLNRANNQLTAVCSASTGP